VKALTRIVPAAAAAVAVAALAAPAASAATQSAASHGHGSGVVFALNDNTTTNAGTVDAASAAGGWFVYVQTGGAGIVDEFAVGAGGALTPIGSVTVPGGVGGEGIAAA
jgi:hypothetical protein